jgi:hypothetical protein
MAPLFGQRTTFLYGKVHGNKFFTPTRKYEIEQVRQAAELHPLRLGEKAEVFFSGEIFNSYLTSTEEKVSRLYSVDGKVTITRDHIDENRLYTFRIIEENETVRIAELYKNDVLFPGYRSTGTVFYVKTAKREKMPFVKTRIGSGPVILQNNDNEEEIDVLLYKTDGRLYFVQINRPVAGPVRLQVTSKIGSGAYKVERGSIRGILNSGKSHEIEESVECDVQSVELGYYFFTEHVPLVVGSVIEARVSKYTRDRVLLAFNGRSGYMLLPHGSRRPGSVVRGVVSEIGDGGFVLERKAVPTTAELSVPFEFEEEESSSSSSSEVGPNDRSLAAERKRARVVNEEDLLMDIKAHPTEAMPVIRYIQHKIEIGEAAAPRRIFKEYLPRLEGREKDNLCISYVNYLMYVKDREVMSCVRRLAKMCSPVFLETVASNTEELGVLQLYYEKRRDRKSFKMYLDRAAREDKEKAYKMLSEHREFPGAVVELIYKHYGDARKRLEKILVDKKDMWVAYLKHESGSYLRGLYRRVVERQWKVADMKEFYRMWLEFERESNGNVDEVKLRAREYVESVKSRRSNGGAAEACAL